MCVVSYFARFHLEVTLCVQIAVLKVFFIQTMTAAVDGFVRKTKMAATIPVDQSDGSIPLRC